MKDDTAIKHLLKAAKYDPCHADAVKEIKRSKDLVFYDSVSSNVFVFLHVHYLGTNLSLFLFCSTSLVKVIGVARVFAQYSI